MEDSSFVFSEYIRIQNVSGPSKVWNRDTSTSSKETVSSVFNSNNKNFTI